MRLGAMLLTAVVVAATSASQASAANSYDPVAAGATTITLSASFSRLLAAQHVSIEVRGGATRKGSRLKLSASGGEFDPVQVGASVENAGTLVFVAGKRKLPFRAIVFKAKRAPLYAKVGGGQLKIAGAKEVAFKRRGFGAAFTATGLRLTAKVATRLDKKLRLGHAISAGQEIGTIASRVSPRTVHLEQEGRAYLAIDPVFYAKLNELFVSLNPIAPAELAAGPTVSFPIGLESTLAPDGTGGTVKTGGALEFLQLGNAQLFWHEPWLEPEADAISSELDIEPSPPRAGKQPRSPLLSLAADGQVAADPSNRTIDISGRSATLTAATAESLDSSFAEGKPVFAAGERLGTLSLAATGE